jgi:hypothetical protein
LRMCVSRKCGDGSISESMEDSAFLLPSREAHVDCRLQWLVGPIAGFLSYLYLYLQCPILGVLLLYLPVPIAFSPGRYASRAGGLRFIAFDSADLHEPVNG